MAAKACATALKALHQLSKQSVARWKRATHSKGMQPSCTTFDFLGYTDKFVRTEILNMARNGALRERPHKPLNLCYCITTMW